MNIQINFRLLLVIVVLHLCTPIAGQNTTIIREMHDHNVDIATTMVAPTTSMVALNTTTVAPATTEKSGASDHSDDEDDPPELSGAGGVVPDDTPTPRPTTNDLRDMCTKTSVVDDNAGSSASKHFATPMTLIFGLGYLLIVTF